MLSTLLDPIARAADDMSGKVHPAVKELAAESLQLLQRRADVDGDELDARRHDLLHLRAL